MFFLGGKINSILLSKQGQRQKKNEAGCPLFSSSKAGKTVKEYKFSAS